MLIERIIDGMLDCTNCGRRRTLIFVVSDPERLGLQYKDERYISCKECSRDLYEDDFDTGDELKTPGSKSWRDGGMAKCPHCEHNHQTQMAYFAFAMFYDPPREVPSKEQQRKQRQYGKSFKKEVRRLWGDRCVAPSCNSDVSEYHHVVPVYQGGLTTTLNVVPLCDSHHDDLGGKGHSHPTWYTENEVENKDIEVLTSKNLSWKNA